MTGFWKSLAAKLEFKAGSAIAAIAAISAPTTCGLIDNKVCAVDGTWSALRLVVRSSNRRSA